MKTVIKSEMEQDIINKYVSGLSCAAISRKIHINHQAIRSFLIRKQIPIRANIGSTKYSFDNHFFDKIDTEAKAYILGFLYADGYNSTSKRSVRIRLNEKDVDILEKIKYHLQATQPITYYQAKSKNNTYPSVDLSFHNQYFSKYIEGLGCTNNKSFTITVPKTDILPENLLSHFIRGYFDGDGCILITPQQQYLITICGNHDFCLSLQNIIFKIIGAKFPMYPHMTIYRLSSQHKQRNFQFLTWLYEGANIYLNRKHNIFMDIKNRKLYLRRHVPHDVLGRFIKKDVVLP